VHRGRRCAHTCRISRPRPRFPCRGAQPRDRAPSLTRLAPSPLPFADQRSLTTTW
jgi:hypothetical protein